MEKKKREEVIEEWKGLIRDCENRPDEVRFDDWCRNAGVSKSNYYYLEAPDPGSGRGKAASGCREDRPGDFKQ